MSDCVELEVCLSCPGGVPHVDLRLSPPNTDVTTSPLDAPRHCRLPTAPDPSDGTALAAALFADAAVQAGVAQAVNMAQVLVVDLRVRLSLAADAAVLAQMPWEVICAPENRASMLKGQRVLFSRYIESADTRRVSQRPRHEQRALVAIASPTDIARWELPAIDKKKAFTDAQRALGGFEATPLHDDGPVSLAAIATELRQGYDILYLLCHGTRTAGGKTLLLLEAAEGKGEASPEDGERLVDELSGLAHPPRLVVLGACHGADAGPGARSATSLLPLGPALAKSGIGAVVAMQGAVSEDTVSRFLPKFFEELQQHGVIDRAMAEARAAIAARPDWWMPVLFMRLKSARLAWYRSGFAEEFQYWESLLTNIVNDKCTPILGPGLTDHIVGARRDVASRLAEAQQFPLARHFREDLPQIAQYLKVTRGRETAAPLVLQHLCNQVEERYARHIPEGTVPTREERKQLPEGRLAEAYDTLLESAWRYRTTVENVEPHAFLAALGCSVYVTTNSESLLTKAIADSTYEGKTRVPMVEVARWNARLDEQPFAGETAAPGIPGSAPQELRPTRTTPLVYQLFGQWTAPDSLVLTEDDYFDFLIGNTANRDLIPLTVRRQLADSALLFLGFHLDDWDFRVLFRGLSMQPGRVLRDRYKHVAVQVDPQESRVVDTERARRYLSEAFPNVHIYWGSVRDFVEELARRRGTAPRARARGAV
jgi:hypothetical protein